MYKVKQKVNNCMKKLLLTSLDWAIKNPYKYLLVINLIYCTICVAVDTRLTTIAYKTSLAPAWQWKISEAICELQGMTNVEDKTSIGNLYTNSAGVEFRVGVWWQDQACQLGGGTVTNVQDILNLKIPKPFRDDIIISSGSPKDIGLFPVEVNP